jgi:hypothetical protein
MIPNDLGPRDHDALVGRVQNACLLRQHVILRHVERLQASQARVVPQRAASMLQRQVADLPIDLGLVDRDRPLIRPESRQAFHLARCDRRCSPSAADAQDRDGYRPLGSIRLTDDRTLTGAE